MAGALEGEGSAEAAFAVVVDETAPVANIAVDLVPLVKKHRSGAVVAGMAEVP